MERVVNDTVAGSLMYRQHEVTEAVLKLALGHPDITAVAAAALKGLKESVGLAPAAVFLVDEETGRPRLVVQQGMPAGFLRQISRAPGGEGIFARVMAGEEVAVTFDQAGGREIASLFPRDAAGGLIAVPVPGRDEVIGLITGLFPVLPPDGSGSRLFLHSIAEALGAAFANIHTLENMRDSYLSTVRALVAAIDMRDYYARGHSDRVAVLASATATEMGLDSEGVDNIREAGYLHDIGKLVTPDVLLAKKGDLTTEEITAIRRHPGTSFQILERARIPFEIKEIIRHHHESFDGSGYPDELAGDRIPLGSRIISVADAYEAMTADRPYRSRMSADESVGELKRLTGRQFDPDVVDAFLRVRSQVTEALAETA